MYLVYKDDFSSNHKNIKFTITCRVIWWHVTMRPKSEVWNSCTFLSTVYNNINGEFIIRFINTVVFKALVHSHQNFFLLMLGYYIKIWNNRSVSLPHFTHLFSRALIFLVVYSSFSLYKRSRVHEAGKPPLYRRF